MWKKEDLLLGQYEINFVNKHRGDFIAEIFHRNYFENGIGSISTPVGHLILRDAQLIEVYNSDKELLLFFRDDVKYDKKTGETINVGDPENRAGSNKALLNRLLRIKNSNLPRYHPELPSKIIDYLIDVGICSEPIGMSIYYFGGIDFIKRGPIWDWEVDD